MAIFFIRGCGGFEAGFLKKARDDGGLEKMNKERFFYEIY